jgi:hypothetical protein
MTTACSCVLLLAAGVLHPAQPAGTAETGLYSYLPHDTDFVLTLNARQIRSWPTFQKKHREEVEQLLQSDVAKQVLQGTGFDPLRDLNRVVIASAASSTVVRNSDNATSYSSGPSFILLQGRFDPAKLRARAEQAAKDMPEKFKLVTVGGQQVLEISGTPMTPVTVALLDKSTVMVTLIKSQAEEGLRRAAGKEKRGLQSRQVRALLAKADAKQAVQWLACGDIAAGGGIQTINQKGKTITKVTRDSLKDSGIEELHGGITLGDGTFKLHTSLRATGPDKARELAGKMEEGIKEARDRIKQLAASDKEWQPLVDALRSVRVTVRGDTISFEARGTGAALIEAVRAMAIVG